MEIRVLGPLAVVPRDEPNLGASLGPSQRRMLAVLCVSAGQVVASDRLADTLGLKSSGAVRTTVHRLRNTTADLIVHQPPGYIVEQESLDSYRFIELLTQARAADPEARVALYSEALGLWHGSAYAEFASEEWARAESVRLDELRATARAERIEALLQIQRITDATADADELVHDEPLRERPRALLMRALALQGRQTEALRAFQDYRDYLAEEAGLEPSSDLVALENQIVSGDVTALPNAGGAESAAVSSILTAPTGTVTFLFTDIEGSTARWESSPDEMQGALATHDEQLRASIEAHNGFVFAHTGDGMCAAFGSAKAAIDASIDAQQRLELPVRMGIATGEAEHRDGNYFGAVLNRTARIMTVGHAGQILVAATTALMVDQAEFTDLGSHRLPDLPELMGIYQVKAHGLRSEFPPLKSGSRDIGNLPAVANELLGRATEIQALGQLLQTQRLVTLTGSAGVGKTSLALHVANGLAFEFPDGLWWVELASVRDAAGVPDAVAGALGITPSAHATVSESIATALSGRRALIILDNCEHVIDAAADVVNALLHGSQHLAVLATSREQLRIAGERVWTVPTLDYSGPTSAAVQLFVQRAGAVTSELDLTADLGAVTEICARLDGLAYAIELAAARMVSMTPRDIADRLDDRFRLLTGPRRGLEHQQTLRQTVQWSHDLLGPDERDVLNRLSVFVDGFDLVGAQSLFEPGRFDEFEIMDLIDSLVRKSLLTTERVSGHVRYGMLETIREFTLDELKSSTELAGVRQLHAQHYRQQAEHYWRLWHGPEQRIAIDWVEAELANLRAAFRSAVDQTDIETAASIAANTALLAQILMVYEPISWVEEVYESALANNVSCTQSMRAAIGLLALTGRPGDAARYAEMGSTAPQPAADDMTTMAWVQFNLALSYRYNGEGQKFVDGCEALAGQQGFAQALGSIGLLCEPLWVDTIEQARELGNRAVDLARELENPYLLTYSLAVYARAIDRWAPTETLAKMREATTIAQNGRLEYWTASIARETAGLEAAHGNTAAALTHYATAFDSFQRMGNGTLAGLALANLSATFNEMKQPEIAATLYGCYRTHGSSMDAYIPGGLVLPTIESADDVLVRAVAAGSEMDFGQAMKYARVQIQNARIGAVDELG